MQYEVNINAFNAAFNPIIMSPQHIAELIKTLKRMKSCIKDLGQINASAYFDIG